MPLTTAQTVPRILLFFPLFCFAASVYSQQIPDTIRVQRLEEVVVKTYGGNQQLRNVAAAVGFVGSDNLSRFGSASVVSAISTIPGIRMEERSPGSYRFNIRGSALRSPFGVRNVKVYYNDLPFTNPGGHTYLNQFGFYNFGSVEVIKGPGSSFYGAGTGGVLLIEQLGETEKPGAFAEYTTGSYGLQNVYGSVISGNENYISKIGVQHQQTSGYRVHSSLRRDVVSWAGKFNISPEGVLKTTFVWGDLFYQTPGALTAADFALDPKKARPGNAFFPGAETAQASVRQRTFLAGASYTQQLFSKLKNQTALYGSNTQLLNPTVQNYARLSEPHYGGRTQFSFVQPVRLSVLNISAGAEWQQGFTGAAVLQNKGGEPDSLQQSYEVANRQSLLFAQATLTVSGWSITAGASLNNLLVKYQPFYPAGSMQQRTFKNKLAPRIALLKKLSNVSVYTSVSKGFSPPTTEEFFPSGDAPNINLLPEDGTNYDVGLRATFKPFSIDVNAFHFALQNSIVQRRTAGGGSQFINAGNTAQNGLETSLVIPLFETTSIIKKSQLQVSHTYHHFIYKNFIKDTIAYSGKRLPGVAPHTLFAGFNMQHQKGWIASLSYLFSDKTPLNDANSAYADAYHLLGAKLGFVKGFAKKWNLKATAGADNLLNQKYSLGNDVNGFGARYFNAAPRRNYYTSLSVQWVK